MILAKLPHRAPDDYGSGEYRASRGNRLHNGIDYQCAAGAEIVAPVTGLVTKLGYPYGDDLSYLYVEITDHAGERHRVFYVDPHCDVGDTVMFGVSVIGVAQNVAAKYTKGHMNNHVHYEVKSPDGSYRNPEE